MSVREIYVKQLKTAYSKGSDTPLGQQVSAAAHEKNEAKKVQVTAESLKQQFNSSIIQSNMDVSVSAGNESLALLYKTAIEGVNDVLKPEFGDNAIQAVYDSGLDVSPKATADRIVSMSTAFFSQYQESNPDMTTEEAAQSFAKIISGGIEHGFSEAREVLTGLNVLQGEIASNIDTTYDLVQNGLQDFVDSYTDSDKEGDVEP